MPELVPEDSSIVELTPKEAVAELEKFVIDNDELLELEEQIGRFNIFDALGVVRQEIRHSNFLAWLLDPAESHGQGQLFLKAILMDLLRETPVESRPLSPIDLDGVDLVGVEVRREWRNIDILIVAQDPAIVIAIENKIDAGEHSNQLARYSKIVRDDFPKRRRMFVFLTPDGDEPSEEDWTTYTYGDIHRVLSRCMRLNKDSIGEEVAAFLTHYLSLIKGRLMEDPTITELCESIYRNHRQAIELLIERVGDPRSRITRMIREALASDSKKWLIEGNQNISCRFIPKQWLSTLPGINKRPQQHPNAWVFAAIRLFPKKVVFSVTVGPTFDTKKRERERLMKAIHSSKGTKHGFKLNRKESGKSWAKVYGQNLLSDTNGLEYNDEIVDSILEHLPAIEKRLNNMGDLMKQIVG